MSSPDHNLLQAICDGHHSLTQVLRLTHLIAAKLDLKDVEEWVDLELNGYPEDVEPPAYRNIHACGLEVYNAYRDAWLPAGDLKHPLKCRQSIAAIVSFSREESLYFPVLKNFPLKNAVGDSFGPDWPQRFIVDASQYKYIITAVANRWVAEVDERGVKVSDIQRFTIALSRFSDF